MSKLQYHTRMLVPSNVSWETGVLTLDFASNHLLTASDEISLEWQDIGRSINTTVLAAPTGVRITVTMTDRPTSLKLIMFVKYFSTGYTGGGVIEGLTSSLGKPAMVQSYVVGTGGAVYTLEVSLDGTHWLPISTVTHTSTSGHTDYVVIDPVVNFVRANVSSIGAATKLVVMQVA